MKPQPLGPMPRNIPTYMLTEDEEQRRLARWLDAKRLLWYHAPNGGSRNTVEAAKLRGMGVKPGVPDICICTPPPAQPESRGVYLELKRREGGRVSPHQQEWMDNLAGAGYHVKVCAGADAAVKELERLGY